MSLRTDKLRANVAPSDSSAIANVVRKAAPKAIPDVDTISRATAREAKRTDDQYTDAQIALVTLRLSTGSTLKSLSRTLGNDDQWASRQLLMPKVQRLMAAVTLSTLGLEAGKSVATLAELRDKTADEALKYRVSVELLDRAGVGNTTAMRAAGEHHAFTFSLPESE